MKALLAGWFGLSLAVVLVGSRAQGWQRLDATTDVPPCTSVVEPGGSRIVIADGDVLRIAGAAQTRLATTNGSVDSPRCLAGSPQGSTFVAAANGLFVTHPEVETLDRLPFDERGPSGPIVGLVADRIDRLWVATATQLFVVHAGLWFHRAHGPGDGLPTPPFRAFCAAADGGLVLHALDGVHGYRPDAAAPLLHEAAIEAVSAEGRVHWRLAGEGQGAVTYRWRLRSHHMLRDVDDHRLRPGRHELLVQAIDRDLDLSEPREVTADVPLPGTFDARWAAAIAAVGGIVIGAWLAVGARRRGHSRGRALLDGGLAVVVALQLGMAMTGIGRTYPFIGFTMYGEVYRESDVLFTPALVARARDGTQVAAGGSFAFATDGVWRHLASLWFADRAAQHAFVAGLGPEVDSVELRIRRCRLTGDGPREVAPFVLARLERSTGR